MNIKKIIIVIVLIILITFDDGYYSNYEYIYPI